MDVSQLKGYQVLHQIEVGIYSALEENHVGYEVI
jgi:hypothetical protein